MSLSLEYTSFYTEVMHVEKIMDTTKYKARLIDEIVERYLKTIGAICIEGPKWCGKTWTSSYHCNLIVI